MTFRLMLTVAIALAAALPARAQDFAGTQEPAESLYRDTLDTPYAEALLKTFAGAVRRQGDPACLTAKSLDEAALVAGGRALFQRYGVQMKNLSDTAFDKAAFEAAFAGRAGPTALTEIKRLKNDANVRAYIALDRPAALAKVADDLMQQFDRYVLIKRIKLEPISPVARGDTDSEATRANPTQAVDAAVDAFLDSHPSRNLDRYFDLLDAMQAARPKGVILPVASKLGPMQFFAGVEKDLAQLCVGTR